MHSRSILLLSAVLTAAPLVEAPLAAAEPKAAAAALKERLPPVPPKEPAEALKTFQVRDGFRLELLASEPLVTDPVAMAYDENGVAYVAEMNDYPYTDKARHKPFSENPADQPIGRIRVLIDRDGDGKFDASHVFAGQLSWPTGVACWQGGIFVAATPDIWYLKDTNGDWKADVRTKVFTGFRKFNVQATINNLIWGLDNWIYGAGASNGGSIVPASQPDATPVSLSRNDFRFDPFTLKLEAISGGARFGNTFDDWGHRFLCNIRNPVQHVVLESQHLARNPYHPVRSVLHDAAEASDTQPVHRLSAPEPWREARARRWAVEESQAHPRSELAAAGYWTSSAGVTVYRGAAYPPKYRGNVFIGEVANNVVNRQILKPAGVTFTATRADQNVEFIASTDNWFRPVNFVNAPDGTLHVLDMYRENIEHPWSIPEDLHALVDLESGRDRGRIYRLAPPGAFKPPPPPRLSQASVEQLVAHLENPNAWWRETAQRLIVERQDKAAVAPLRTLLSQSTNVLARMHALYALQGLRLLKDYDILIGLEQESPDLQIHAIRLAEPRLKRAPMVEARVLALATGPDLPVRFQAALALGEVPDTRAALVLADIARKDGADAWVRAAVLSSAVEVSDEMLTLLQRDRRFAVTPAGVELARQLSLIVGAMNQAPAVNSVLLAVANDTGCPPEFQSAVVLGLGDGLKRAGKTVTSVAAGAGGPAAAMVNRLLADAEKVALDGGASAALRQQAAQLLGFSEYERVAPTLARLLEPRQPNEVQLAAVRTLAAFPDPRVAGTLLAPWRGCTPAIRAEIVEAVVGRKERIGALLGAVESGAISPLQISAARRTYLMRHRDAELQQRAAKLFQPHAAAPRQAVIEKHRAALDLKGDATRGRQVFEDHCMTCHRRGERGNDVGPNLNTVRQWFPEQILVNVLDPNREVSPNFLQYEVELKDGQSISGMIADETATSLTLKRADNVAETILRQNIARITSSGLSLMPEGLEAGIPPQAMADLLAFLLGK